MTVLSFFGPSLGTLATQLVDDITASQLLLNLKLALKNKADLPPFSDICDYNKKFHKTVRLWRTDTFLLSVPVA